MNCCSHLSCQSLVLVDNFHQLSPKFLYLLFFFLLHLLANCEEDWISISKSCLFSLIHRVCKLNSTGQVLTQGFCTPLNYKNSFFLSNWTELFYWMFVYRKLVEVSITKTEKSIIKVYFETSTLFTFNQVSIIIGLFLIINIEVKKGFSFQRNITYWIVKSKYSIKNNFLNY